LGLALIIFNIGIDQTFLRALIFYLLVVSGTHMYQID
jgi:hypothetical protein